MVETITITPDLTVSHRLSGKISLKIEGSLTRLLQHADVPIERDMKYSSGPRTVLDVADIRYMFTTSFAYASERLSGVLQTLPAISQLLDAAQAPVTRSAFLQALGVNSNTSVEDQQQLEARLRMALDYLLKRGLAHNIDAGPYKSGWVWSDTPVEDAEWKARALRSASEPLPRRLIKAWAPEASVVVIGPSERDGD